MRLLLLGLVLTALAFVLVDITVTRATFPQRRSAAKLRGTPVGDLFRNNCARCHGADGAGDTPLGHTYKTPDFTDPDWWRKHSDITSTASLLSISFSEGVNECFRIICFPIKPIVLEHGNFL